MDIYQVKRLLHKALIYRLMANIDRFLRDSKISHSKLSVETGRSRNWFNDAFNNNEDITISSLTRILGAINRVYKIHDYKISDLFDEKVLHITEVLTRFSDEEKNKLPLFDDRDKELFLDLMVEWRALDAKNRLSIKEQECLKALHEVVLAKEHKEWQA
ncbi:hypothetical protein NIZ91_04290 [Bacillus sp. 1780r2a1]|nr:hypothetical protein NIZ91_04290 [Bacillus sp. 1780r2a1]